MGRLSGKVAVITGAAQGQGAAHVARFLDEGASVVATDINEQQGRDYVARFAGASVEFVPQDVRLLDHWTTVINVSEERFGPVSVLVNNAAVDLQRSVLETTEEEYRRVIDTNQLSVFLGMQAAAKSMRKAGNGSIVNISSILGTHNVSPLRVAYAATKFAIRGMTKVAAIELAEFGIRVNSVHPGFVETPMLAVATQENDRMASIPMKRLRTRMRSPR